MRWLSIAVLILVARPGLAQEKARTIYFSRDDVGKVPAGWKVDRTGTAEGSVWQVEADETAPSGKGHVLAQKAEGPRPLFNLCVTDNTSYRDLDLSVSFKAVAGEIDQGGGPVWRYQDANNYYVARMNPLENNFRVYKVVDGKRTQLGSADVTAPAGKWHVIRIVHRGDQVQCFLNGKLYLDVKDQSFVDAGKVGLWTKADAETRFDSLVIGGK